MYDSALLDGSSSIAQLQEGALRMLVFISSRVLKISHTVNPGNFHYHHHHLLVASEGLLPHHVYWASLPCLVPLAMSAALLA